MLHLHDVYINTSRWPVTIYTNEMDKPDYKNGDGNGWMERNSTSSRNGPLPRAGADHQLHSLSHARSPFRIHTLFWHATSNHFLVPDAVIHTPHMHTPHILIMLSLPGGHCQMTGFHRCIARLRLPRDLLRTFSCSQWCWRCMKQKCRR
jgi:hypothetical protein